MPKLNMSLDLSLSKEEMQQSEIVDQKFIELLNSRKVAQEDDDPYEFQIDDDEEEKIRAQFFNIAQGKQTMDYAQFRESLGLLGREDSFISRIFHIIDTQKLGTITEEDYLKYIRTILHGSQFEQELLGWKIISGGKNELQIKDLMQLFQQISIVWNALTGQIVQPRKKYIEELFTILDVDQDQVITFQDYRIFYKSQPFIFGWFEYFNNIDLNDSVTKIEMEKTRNLLQVQNSTHKTSYKNAEELKKLMDSQQTIIDSKMVQLLKQIQNAAHIGNELQANASINMMQSQSYAQQSSSQNTKQPSLASLSHIGKFFKSPKMQASQITQGSQQISRLRRRKQKMDIQQNKDSNFQMIKNLEKIMDKCYKAMNACSQYRQMKQLSRKYSPTKLKLKEVKIQAITQKESRVKEEEKKETKKKNILVYFGHKNWNLVLNLMVGLRKSIRSLYELNSYLELKSSHFKEQHQFLLGNKVLNGKNKQVYKFIQIAPVVFEKLRTNYGISNIQYQRSVGPQSLLNSLLMGNLTGLNQKCSTGKSGAFFYLTLDSKIFLKTIPKHEFLFYIVILQNYYRHMKQFTNTLIVRIYGLYKLKIFQNKQKVDTIYFISMENIFKQIGNDSFKIVSIKQIYDLKGSLYGRSGQQGKELKDKDWIDKRKKIHLSNDLKKIFRNQIKIDSRFFKNNNINDYSLMVTICEIDKGIWQKERQNAMLDKSNNVFKSYKGGILGSNPGQFYILGIIDILTVYEIRKKLEYVFKSTFLSKDVSCIPPKEYCNRFRNFIYQIVQEDEDVTTIKSED